MRRANALHVAALATSLCAACGGEDKGRPSPDIVVAPPLDECARAEKYEFLPVVDFEAKGKYATCEPGVSCRADDITPFYFNYDRNHTDLGGDVAGLCPVPRKPFSSNIDANPRDIVGEALPDGPRCGVSAGGMHFWASNVGLCFGENGRLGWGAAIDLEFAKYLDASDYDGVSFWVRRGSAASAPAFILSVVDEQNEGITDTIAGSATQPHCGCKQTGKAIWSCSSDPDTTYADAQKCDAYGSAVSLTDDWSFVPITFAGLRQKGFGTTSGPFDRSKISRLQFLMTFGDWDFWIDDIAFFKAR